MAIPIEDRYLPRKDTTDQPPGMVEDTTGTPVLATLGVSATFTSRWYSRGVHQTLKVRSEGSLAHDIGLEETFDNPNVGTPIANFTHTPVAAAVNSGGFRGTASFRVVAPFFRIRYINGAGAQAGARMFGVLVNE